MPLSWVIVLGLRIGPSKSSLFGEMVTLAPESQMTGKVESALSVERKRLGAWSATRIDGPPCLTSTSAMLMLSMMFLAASLRRACLLLR